MATQTTQRRHELVPLSELEFHILKLHTDQDFNFWQHQMLPPEPILRLHERYHATADHNAGGQPPKPPEVDNNSPEPGWDWRELLRWEVRREAVWLAAAIGILAPFALVIFVK
jgi:hypothetical protein